MNTDITNNTEPNIDIKAVEDFSLNAWPSHQMQVYDGWILRFSHFYTHRTNCVEQIGVSCLPLAEKVPYCEEIYRRWNTPPVFKISPVGDPDLDRYLENRGYVIEHITDVMTTVLGNRTAPDMEAGDCGTCDPLPPLPEGLTMRIMDRVDDLWLQGLFRLKTEPVEPIHRIIVPRMYDAIPKDEVALSVLDGDNVIATGLGILDRGYVGIYAIHVDPAYRRKGIARQIVSTLLEKGREQGAQNAYLQVVSDNYAARALYRQLGFLISYRYWFRVKR